MAPYARSSSDTANHSVDPDHLSRGGNTTPKRRRSKPPVTDTPDAIDDGLSCWHSKKMLPPLVPRPLSPEEANAAKELSPHSTPIVAQLKEEDEPRPMRRPLILSAGEPTKRPNPPPPELSVALLQEGLLSILLETHAAVRALSLDKGPCDVCADNHPTLRCRFLTEANIPLGMHHRLYELKLQLETKTSSSLMLTVEDPLHSSFPEYGISARNIPCTSNRISVTGSQLSALQQCPQRQRQRLSDGPSFSSSPMFVEGNTSNVIDAAPHHKKENARSLSSWSNAPANQHPANNSLNICFSEMKLFNNKVSAAASSNVSFTKNSLNSKKKEDRSDISKDPAMNSISAKNREPTTSSVPAIQKSKKFKNPDGPTTANKKVNKENKSKNTCTTSTIAAVSTASKSINVASLTGSLLDESMPRKSFDKKGIIPKKTTHRKPSKDENALKSKDIKNHVAKRHSKNRLIAILQQNHHRWDTVGNESVKSNGSHLSRSTASKLRRSLFSSTSKKTSRSSSVGKDDEQVNDMGKRKNCLLHEKKSPVPSALADCNISISPDLSADGVEHSLPALVMAPLSSSAMNAFSDISSSMQSSPRRQSLLSISEYDVLRKNDLMKPSLSPMARSMASISNLGSPHSPNSKVLLNLEAANFPALPLHVHHEGSLADVESPSLCGSIITNYSDIMRLGDMDRTNLTRNCIDDNPTRIINLPWYDKFGSNDYSMRVHGLYTGPVNNDFLQPHGEGTLVIQTENESITFCGRWDKGKLVSTLSVATPEAQSCSESVVSLESGKGSYTLDEYLHKSPVVIANSLPRSANNDEKGANMKYVINKSSILNPIASTNKHQHPSLKYTLGEACRTPMHMIIHRSNTMAIQSVALVKKWDQVFIKRSNGLWTVAVMIDRALQPKNIKYNNCGDPDARWRTVWEIDPRSIELEESMLFAIDGDGATKIINKKSWGKYVRRMKSCVGLI